MSQTVTYQHQTLITLACELEADYDLNGGTVSGCVLTVPIHHGKVVVWLDDETYRISHQHVNGVIRGEASLSNSMTAYAAGLIFAMAENY